MPGSGIRGYLAGRQARRYRRAVGRAFAQVTFYREQWAAAGAMLDEPIPTPTSSLPDPPHTLTPFSRPWSPAQEPPLWTPRPAPLAAALRLAGCAGRVPVLEVREALLDHLRLPGRGPWRRGPAYRVLLSPTAVVADSARRDELNAAALAVVAAAGGGRVIGGPAELVAMPELADAPVVRVYRLPPGAAGEPPGERPDGPILLHDPVLGYVGALVPACGGFHVDWHRVHARERGGAVTFSLPGSRRPTLLDIVPPGADTLRVGTCASHGTPVLAPRGR